MDSTKKIIRRLRSMGLTVEMTGGQHLKLTHPDMAGPVFVGSSPSTPFMMVKVLADIRRQKQRKLNKSD